MIEAIKFVKNAVSSESINPKSTFFKISEGRITCTNNNLCISSPIASDIDLAPKASHFYKAISTCDDEIKLTEKDDHLIVKSGKFRSKIPCGKTTEYPVIIPTGDFYENSDRNFLEDFKLLSKFVAKEADGENEWSNHIFLNGDSLIATNNIVGIQIACFNFNKKVVIPITFIKTIIKCKKEFYKLQISDNTISAIYPDGEYISSRLMLSNWPDFDNVLNQIEEITNYDLITAMGKELSDEFFSILKKLAKFSDNLGRCYIEEDKIRVNSEGDDAEIEFNNNIPKSIYNISSLLLLENLAEEIAFNNWPTHAAIWYGDNMRGFVIGMRE